MRAIPTPGGVLTAASNVYAKVSGRGLADLRPVPRSLIDSGPQRSVYRLQNPSGRTAEGDPVLLVPPLAAPALCFDLRRGASLAEYLVTSGRPTYLVDYGTIGYSDRALGIEHWVDEVLPRAIDAVSADRGGAGVHLVAWSLGGIFALLTAAAGRALPIASITAVASPIDITQIPLIAPIRPLVDLTRGLAITGAYRILGAAPRTLVRWAFQLSSVDKYITKPAAILTHLDDTEFLAQIEAVDHFTDNMIAYPGRTFGQLYHLLFRANDLCSGSMELGGRKISLAAVRVPVLVVAGEADGIAPQSAVKRVVSLLEAAPEVRYRVAPGGHLGVLTGRNARSTTWVAIDEFLTDKQRSPSSSPDETPRTA